MEDIILQRIKEIIKIKSSSPTDFAIKCGIPQTSFCRYINQGKTPTIDKIVQILATFPDISAEWLLRGTGTMYSKAHAEVIVNGPQSIKGDNNITNSPHAQASTHQDEIITLLRSQVETQSKQIDSLNRLVQTLANK